MPSLLAFFCVCGGTFGPRSSAASFVESAVSYQIAQDDSMSYAAGFVDQDLDGDLDLFLNNHWKTHAELFHNEGGTSFVPRSTHYLAATKDRHDQLWADFDNDGDLDQYLCHGRDQANELYRNDGFGRFVDYASIAGVSDDDGRGREMAVADFDLDGFVDIFLVNDFRGGFVRPSRLFWNNGDGTFTAAPNDGPLFRSRLHTSAVDYDDDGYADIVTTDPWVSGEFYRNIDGSGFVDVTGTVFPGIQDPLVDAQGLSWADYDNDGDLDLFVARGNRAVWDYAGIEAIRFVTTRKPRTEATSNCNS